MGEALRLETVPLSSIPANEACCDAAGERNYRRGYHQGFAYAVWALADHLPEHIQYDLERYIAAELGEWRQRGTLPNASRSSFPPKPNVGPRKRQTRLRVIEAEPICGVYIIRAEESNRVKIGWSVDIHKRLKVLETGSPFVISLLRKIPCTEARRLEGRLHKRYAEYRKHGEWFALPPEILAALLEEDFA